MSDENPLRIGRVEANKHVKEDQGRPDDSKKDLNSMVAAAFSCLLKKVLVNLSEGRLKPGARSYGTSIYAEIDALRKCFRELEVSNHAKDAAFTERFSQRWNTFFSAFMHLSPREPTYKKIDAFINFLNSYPSADEHALGFYLTHYAGEAWLPFPYLEILKKLHRDFVTHKEKSDLHKIVKKLTEILGDA